MNVAARLGTADDAVVVDDIASIIREELAPLRGGAVLLAQHGPRSLPGTRTFVGSIDDVVVGYADVSVETLSDGSLLGVIRDLAVLLGARGVGVGEAILDQVIEYCRGQGCRGIDSVALPGTRETKNFFETFGFTARLLVVHSSLVPDAEPEALGTSSAGSDPS